MEVLEDWATERVLALLGKLGEELAVTFDDEAGQAAFEVSASARCRYRSAMLNSSSLRLVTST